MNGKRAETRSSTSQSSREGREWWLHASENFPKSHCLRRRSSGGKSRVPRGGLRSISCCFSFLSGAIFPVVLSAGAESGVAFARTQTLLQIGLGLLH